MCISKYQSTVMYVDLGQLNKSLNLKWSIKWLFFYTLYCLLKIKHLSMLSKMWSSSIAHSSSKSHLQKLRLSGNLLRMTQKNSFQCFCLLLSIFFKTTDLQIIFALDTELLRLKSIASKYSNYDKYKLPKCIVWKQMYVSKWCIFWCFFPNLNNL